MTCMKNIIGNRRMLDVEQFWPSTWTPSVASCTNSSITPTPSVPSRLWPSCCDALFLSLSLCLYLGLSTPPSLAVSSYPFLPRSPHACLCFQWAALLSPCNLSPWQSHLCGTLDLRLLFGANTCPLTLVPSLRVTFSWMPRHFVLPVGINSRIITRLNTSHLQATGFY